MWYSNVCSTVTLLQFFRVLHLLYAIKHELERKQLVKIAVREFLDDILNTNSMRIIVR